MDDASAYSMSEDMAGSVTGLNSAPASAAAPVAGGAPPANKSSHPTALFFHLFFKGAALFCYTFLRLFTDSFIITFIACVTALAFDFWTVKNVTGRLLVGLRWWNEILEDGSNKWVFESRADSRQANPFDSLVFWGALFLTPPIWVLVGILFSGFKLQWLIVVIVALLLSVANVAGYWRCQKDASRRVNQFVARTLMNAAVANVAGGDESGHNAV